MSAFARLAPRLQAAIAGRLGWTRLRPVQEAAGDALLDGCNAVVLAPTAGGKTEAAMFPVLSGMVDDPPAGLAGLYIAPIKALLNNQAERLGLYTEMVGLGRFVWHGDVGAAAREAFLAEPTALLMTTPESLEVMLVSRKIDAAALFGDLRVVVVDEIHAMAGTDRGAHLISVVERLARLSRHDVQRVGLSATVGNPYAILAWLQGTSARPGRVIDPPKEPGRRQLLVVHRDDLGPLALDAAKVAKGAKSLFFCQSRATTELVAERMRDRGTEVLVHHSAVSLEERTRAEERFARGADVCIVATSTLELGIDVGDLDRVLQVEAPDTVSSFLQRMGRTGRRAGQASNTTFFCQTEDGVLQAIALVELAKRGWVESVEVSDRCWPVLIHQLLAMSLASDGIPPGEAWEHLSRVPDLAGIHRAEFDRLLAWMIRDRSFLHLSGRLVLGPKAERRFGRRNFMDLYAVFSSPQSYTVQTTAGALLGTLNQGFVDRLVDGVSCFLLAGRAWFVQRVQHGDRRVIVDRAPTGRQPTWGGYLPQFLGMELCQATLEVLTSEEEYGYLHETAQATLEARRAAFAGILAPGVGGIEEADGELRWWTFAGGRVNSTLRHALMAVGGDWKVIPDNHVIKIRAEGIGRGRFDEARARLGALELWEDAGLWAEVAANLPSYRLSKFQPLMPPWVEREVIAAHLLDVAGAWRWLSGQAAPSLARVPAVVREVRPDDPSAPATPERTPAPPTAASGGAPIRHVTDATGLAAAIAALRRHQVVGLDVETTLQTRALCLVQLACTDAVFLIDALEVEDLSPLKAVLGDPDIEKVIHYADFERSVLGRHGIVIDNVVDTHALSHALRPGVDGGHSLKAVAARELGLELDKTEQTSDWAQRPLSASQVAYAALDAEVLLRLYEVL